MNKYPRARQELNDLEVELDNCEVCKGVKGGALGNENIVDGVVMCDYCHSESMKVSKLLRQI